MRIAKLIVRVILGLVFLVSGIAKVLDTQAFVQLLTQYGLGGFANLGVFIPPLEILAGLLMILNIQTKNLALILSIVTLLFSIVFLDVFFERGIKDCGCFGNVEFLKLPPWASFLRNFIIITSSFWLYKVTVNAENKLNSWVLYIVILISAVAFTVSGVTFNKPILTPSGDGLMGSLVQQTFLNDVAKFDYNKKYAVFLFSPGCYHCWDMTENVKSLKASGYVDEVIGISPAEFIAEERSYEKTFKINFQEAFIPLSLFTQVVSVTPMLIMIKHNKIISVNSTGVIDNGYTLIKFPPK